MKKANHKLLSLTALLALFLVGCQNDADQSTASSQSQESVSSEASSEKEESKEKESSKEESESKEKKEKAEKAAKEEKTESESQAEETESDSSVNESSVPTIAGDLGRTTSHQGIDIEQLQQGDHSTLVGTWRNGNGEELVIDEDGYVNGNLYIFLDPFRMESQTMIVNIKEPDSYGGAALNIIPAGTQMKVPMLDLVDASDYSRDRLLVAQTYGTMEMPEEFYYRVD
ncbi:DUF6287 domain-containing protein [Aerococcus urinae]|uniref:DUF6287 domain-containing protein n=1 Tax=Aerococcus urinae TaxID=1376 RepID=UPI0018E17C95|nr:DUF6287 domain-containing protein [Aerococcus urinae]